MGVARQTVRIDASPERVWDVLIDVERLPEWNVEVIAVEDATGPLDRAGAAYTQVFTAGAERCAAASWSSPSSRVARASSAPASR